MLDLTTTEARREVFQITLDWLKAGGHSTDDKGETIGFDMTEVIFTREDNDGDPVDDYNGNECGTVCCMLGHQKLVGAFGEEIDSTTHSIASPHHMALNNLFFPGPEQLGGLYIRMAHISPAMAAATLERYIETGKVEWRREELT